MNKQAFGVLMSSESVEWYTPPHVIECARQAMGSIDLDPASCQQVNERYINASTYWDKAHDGLARRDWFGNVWLNPPYGKVGARSNQEIWATRLIDEYYANHVSAAILLTRSAPGYAWWEYLFRQFTVCMVQFRLRFLRLVGDRFVEGRQSVHGTSLWYIGNQPGHFYEAFEHLGRVVQPKLKGVYGAS